MRKYYNDFCQCLDRYPAWIDIKSYFRAHASVFLIMICCSHQLLCFGILYPNLGSILENAEKMGAPIPPLLKNVLEKMRDSNDDKNASSL